MPLYEYRCVGCGRPEERLQPLGAAPPEDGCPDCGKPWRRRYSRVAVRYGTWGFNATDRMVRDTRGKDFRELRERAERISDGGP